MIERIDADIDREDALFYLGVLTFLAVDLRLIFLGAPNYLSSDEVIARIIVTSYGPVEMVTTLPQFAPNPPFFFLVFDAWTAIAGTSRLAMRSLSVVLGAASVPAIYLVGREVSGRSVGLVAALVLALSSFHVNLSQIARMYGLFGLLGLLSYLCFIRLLDGWSRRRALGYGGVTVLTGLTHGYGSLLLAAQAVTVVALRVFREGDDGVDLRRWLPLQAAVGLLMAPWYVVFLWNQLHGPGHVEWIAEPSLHLVVLTPFVYVWPLYAGLPIAILVPFAALTVAGVPDRLRRVSGPPWIGDVSRDGLVLSVWLVLPVATAVAVSYTVKPLVMPRYFTPIAAAGVVLLARGVENLERRQLRRLALVAILVVSIVGLYGLYTTKPQLNRFGWGPATAFLEEEAQPGDFVLVVHGGELNATSGRKRIGPSEELYASDLVRGYLTRDDLRIVGVESTVPREEWPAAEDDRTDVWLVFERPNVDRTRIERMERELAERYRWRDSRLFNGRVAVSRYDR